MNGNVIASSTTLTDNEQLVIPVVSQEMYFVRILGVNGATNVYDLEIENFPAPIPATIHLDPQSDTGMMNNDNHTAVVRPRFIIQADLSAYVSMGIPILDGPTAAAGNTSGVGVWVSIVDSATGQTVSGFATPIGDSTTLFEFTPATNLSNGVFITSAAVQVFDLQQDANGTADPATGRTELGEVLWWSLDTFAPTGPGFTPPILLTASDSGMFNDDHVTHQCSPAFFGFSEPGAKIRLFANRDGAPPEPIGLSLIHI